MHFVSFVFFFPVQYNLLVHWTVDVCMFSENQESGICLKKKTLDVFDGSYFQPAPFFMVGVSGR